MAVECTDYREPGEAPGFPLLAAPMVCTSTYCFQTRGMRAAFLGRIV